MVTIPPTALPPGTSGAPAPAPPTPAPAAGVPGGAPAATAQPLAPSTATLATTAQAAVVVSTTVTQRQPQSLPGILFPPPQTPPPPPPTPSPQAALPSVPAAPASAGSATPAAAVVQQTVANLPLPTGAAASAGSGIPGTPPPLALANGTVPPPANLVKPPAWTAALPTGAQVPGVVLSRSAEGLAVVRTALGPVAIATPLPLQPGTPVTLSVQTPGAAGTVQVLAPRQPIVMPPGAAPLPGQTVSATLIQAPPNQGTAALALPGSGAQASPLLTAQLAGQAVVEGAPAIPFGLSGAGDRVSLRVVTVNQPAVANPAQPAGATAGAAGILANAAAAARAALASASGLATPLLGASAPPVATGGGPALTAQVVGATVAAQPVVLAGGSLLALETAPLPVGTSITLQSVARLPSAGSAPLPRGTESLLANLTQLMDQVDSLPVAAQTALLAAIPKPGPRLAAEMLHYLGALRTGQAGNWIGEGLRVELEKSGRGRAAKVLGDDFQQASKDVSAQSSDWRVYTLPIAHHQVVQPVRLFVHRADGDEDDGRDRSGDGTRFVIDLDLSALGPIQIDGFSRPPRLDVVLRTPTVLPEPLRIDMLQMFAGATQARGVVGALSFQVAPRVNPLVPKPVERPGWVV
ncbi:MAG: hypothetical protein SF002_09810 [Alphaproteobacteria bacterium]|nr:hypothetical protein [Alphaproteobacteria bacterium]